MFYTKKEMQAIKFKRFMYGLGCAVLTVLAVFAFMVLAVSF